MLEGSTGVVVRSLMVTLSFIVLVTGLSGCGKNPTDILDAPSSSEVQSTSAYPAVVLIALPGGRGACTGTFVSPRAIVTAAHCTQQAGTYTVFTSFGSFATQDKYNLSAGLVDDPNDVSVLILGRDSADPVKGQITAIGTTPQVGDSIRIVGFGCNNLDTTTGAGVKRTGTNKVAELTDYLELYTTPNQRLVDSHAANPRAILGPENQAGSCFGDSGGPMFQTQSGILKMIGITHAGGWEGDYIRSQYVNLDRQDNKNFLAGLDQQYALNLSTGCWNSGEPDACGPSSANFNFRVLAFFRDLWHGFQSLLVRLKNL